MDNLSRIATTDNRLLRRLTRDYRQRGADALSTLSRWASVRRGEEKHIFPYQAVSYTHLIKTVGEFEATVRLHKEVKATIKFTVNAAE